MANPLRATRNSDPVYVLTQQEAMRRSEDLQRQALLMPVGNARTTVLRESNKYRAFAEMKQFLQGADR